MQYRIRRTDTPPTASHVLYCFDCNNLQLAVVVIVTYNDFTLCLTYIDLCIIIRTCHTVYHACFYMALQTSYFFLEFLNIRVS